jgi:MoaA/NifB/PqqE/SkfB family radical SAM enzyme
MKKIMICYRPFDQLVINHLGDVYVCCYVKKAIGNIFQDSKEDIMEAVWNSEAAKKIRNSIYDQSYTYCNKTFCTLAAKAKSITRAEDITTNRIIVKNQLGDFLSGPARVMFNHDNSCNLYCVSCRKSIYRISKSKQDELISIQNSFLKKNTLKNAKEFHISVNGEPFASSVYLDLLKNLNVKDYPKLKIIITSNGLFLTPKMWDNLKNIHYAISQIHISIDAATAKTYEKIRLGGKFKKLKKNLQYLSKLRNEKSFDIFCIKFVVSSVNFNEMVDFVMLGKKLNCDYVNFQLITKFNSFTEEEYQRVAIHNKNHPKHKEFKKVLNNPIFNENIVNLINFHAVK